jgi:hypothetical protein
VYLLESDFLGLHGCYGAAIRVQENGQFYTETRIVVAKSRLHSSSFAVGF